MAYMTYFEEIWRGNHVSIIVLMGLFGIGMAGSTVEAQSLTEPEKQERTIDRGVSPDQGKEGAQEIPSWAEPSDPSSRTFDQPNSKPKEGAMTNQEHLAPPPPDPPNNVPVDGGILWLILAGGSYGTWKLWKS